MEMVAAAKLRRAQERVLAARPYSQALRLMLENLSGASEDLRHPLFEVRPVRRRLLVVIASDKGLCGSHNMNVFRTAVREIEEARGGDEATAVAVVPVGRRTFQFFQKRHFEMPISLPELGDQVDFLKARRLSKELVAMQLDGRVDRVDVLYTRFFSTMSRRVELSEVLPITPPRTEQEGASGRPAAGGGLDYIFEPDPDAIFRVLLPRYVENRILQAMAESLASEHSARMVSMGAATRNAADLIDHLTLVGNKLRQAAITREISEIIGGAEGLK